MSNKTFFAKKVEPASRRRKQSTVSVSNSEARVCFSPEILDHMGQLKTALETVHGSTAAVEELTTNQLSVARVIGFWGLLQGEVKRTDNQAVKKAFDALDDAMLNESAVTLRIKRELLAGRGEGESPRRR